MTITYPVIVYYGVQRASPAVFALLLAGIAAVKFAAVKDKKDFYHIAVLVMAIIFSFILAITNNELLLRLYPVVISIAVALIFASSLRQPENILLRLARLAGRAISAQAPFYTRRLTMVWVALLSVNAIVALYLALFGTLAQWALYCGFLSYILFGVFFIIELIYRHFYIARHRQLTFAVTKSNDDV